MAYMTSYSLSWPEPGPDMDAVVQAMAEIAPYFNGDQAFSRAVLNEGEEGAWYDHDQDLRRLSQRFPGVLFTMQGQGENPDDLWETHYKGGKLQHCPAEITFPPFDESKLVE